MSFFLDSEKLQTAQTSQLNLLQQMSTRVFNSMEQLNQLNMKAARTAMDTSFSNYSKLMSVRDPQGLAALQGSLLNPTEQVEQMMEYSRQAYDVCTSTQTEMANLLEQQIATGTQQMQSIVEDMAKNVPSGGEPLVAAFKSAIDGANTVYSNASKAGRSAREMAEANMATVSSMARQTARDVNAAAGEASNVG